MSNFADSLSWSQFVSLSFLTSHSKARLGYTQTITSLAYLANWD